MSASVSWLNGSEWKRVTKAKGLAIFTTRASNYSLVIIGLNDSWSFLHTYKW